MAAPKRSQAVDGKIKECWAKLATIAFKGAVSSAELGNFQNAETKMEWLARWLDKAGAQATRWSFRS